MRHFLIAIDGPAGSGKSTVAKLVAERLGMNYLDTGAMYRAVALYLHSKNLSPSDDLSNELDHIDLCYKDGELYINGARVSEQIRSAQAGKLASDFAVNPAVRSRLTQLQRDICKDGKFVVEGRDIGTVVLPNAQVKIFLTASFDERVRRRLKELQEKGIHLTFEEIANQIRLRDEQDSKRSLAPMKPAEDALVIDTTGKNIDQVVEEICQIALRRMDCENNRC
ncbi:(d)CMP kinase [Thermotoga profunda]|uniref:(d)CMP kinase n=1 Tax=Thermotoga profunda TaxID=1508420 RepID=UPI000597914D|nr:(d)CMP kinase [Thermotoga profunda]